MTLIDTYSIPEESKKLLWEGIIHNPLHKDTLPREIESAAQCISFTGSKLPFLPQNWRVAESISSLKAFQGAMLNILVHKKYGIPFQRIHVDTDHAQLFIMSPAHPWLAFITEHENVYVGIGGDRNYYEKYFPNRDTHRTMEASTPLIDLATTNIYQAADGRYYHVHGSLDPSSAQKALGIDRLNFLNLSSFQAGCDIVAQAISKHAAQDLDSLMNDQHRQAGTICYSVDEYRASEQGKANAHVGLYQVHHHPNLNQQPVWWDGLTPPAHDTPSTSIRPLLGLKVVDLTRIIASPTLVRELAEMGASVMRVTAPHITDMSQLQLDLGWGKWNSYLDLRKEEDREKLRSLIMEADVVVDGYRPGVMKKWGFGPEEVLEMVKDRERGIIYVHENCYGWNGPWAHRSGWQQISDACTGVSLKFGQAMGTNEPVTPTFPNSDFCTGVAGAVGVLQALISRGEKGGSYIVDVALNYYSQWLTGSCGEYPREIWDDIWEKYDRFSWKHTDNMGITIPRALKILRDHRTPIFDEKYFEVRENRALGVRVKTVKPILQFEGARGTGVMLGYNVGSRPNGTDAPRWPKDLLTEVVA